MRNEICKKSVHFDFGNDNALFLPGSGRRRKKNI